MTCNKVLSIIAFICIVMPLSAEIRKSPVLNVKERGALADGVTDNQKIIQKAIDEASTHGGGTVLLEGGVFLSSPLTLSSNVTLRIDEGTVLLATPDPSAYKGEFYSKKIMSFITAGKDNDVANITITGKGTIDGNGASWWKEFFASGKKSLRPKIINIARCKNLRIEDVTLKDAPFYHIVPHLCENVEIVNVRIIAPEKSPNTDGIDPSQCRNVKITNCTIDVGDDNIALKSGNDSRGKTGRPCENVFVTHCTFLNGHGVSIGSETNSGVRNLVVTDCTFKGTKNGIRIKSSPSRGGLIQNISYSDIKMENVKNPLLVTWDYVDGNSKDDPKWKSKDAMPYLKDVRIKNFVSTNGGDCGNMAGISDSIIENISIENAVFSGIKGMTIRNAKNIFLKNVVISPQRGKQLTLENVQELHDDSKR